MKKNVLELRLNQYVCFGICLLLMLVIPIVRDQKIIGFNLDKDKEEPVNTISVNDEGITVVNTTEIGNKFIGYGGTTPLEIYIKDGKISKIKTLPNQETPEFFGAVKNSDLLDSFEGKTLQQAADAKVDAVSGATYSSNAVINNIKAGVNYALDENHKPVADAGRKIDLKWYITILIILMGAILPLWFKNKKYRYLQLILNVVVLGIWGGTFVSYSIMVSALSNGLASVVLIPVALLLLVAFIYPMFGKINHYCNWLCPYGSLQDLAGLCSPKKIKVSPRVAKGLKIFREILWFGLMWLLWTGLWFDWMGYEPFAAFFFTDASAVVLGIAGAFILLSVFIPRPYCRYVCPTGTLFKLSEGRR